MSGYSFTSLRINGQTRGSAPTTFVYRPLLQSGCRSTGICNAKVKGIANAKSTPSSSRGSNAWLQTITGDDRELTRALLFYKTVNCSIGVILKCSIFQIRIKSALVNHIT